jgi:hypothetical protein
VPGGRRHEIDRAFQNTGEKDDGAREASQVRNRKRCPSAMAKIECPL